MMTHDLVTFGETMLRLSPPKGDRIEVSNQLDFRVAGAESNVAITAARLGADSAWLSKLPDSPLGRKVTTAIRQHGVTTDVVWTDAGRQGTYYLEFGTEPRGTNVVYDRTDAAVTTATSEELPLDRIKEANIFYTSGITPALSPTLEETTRSLLKTAQASETTTVFDLNYRAKLWPPEVAEETYESLLPTVDILIAAERDLRNILNLTGSASTMIDGLQSTYDHDIVIVTRGEEGAIARAGGELVKQPAYETDTLDPIGTGDAFVGGFLAHNLREASLAEALDVAAATAALKRTMRGDIAVVTPEEVERIRADTDIGINR